MNFINFFGITFTIIILANTTNLYSMDTPKKNFKFSLSSDLKFKPKTVTPSQKKQIIPQNLMFEFDQDPSKFRPRRPRRERSSVKSSDSKETIMQTNEQLNAKQPVNDAVQTIKTAALSKHSLKHICNTDSDVSTEVNPSSELA